MGTPPDVRGIVTDGGRPVVFVGRSEESAAVERLLTAARDGAGGALVLRGEAGAGKTALLRRAEQAADGMRIVRVAGVRPETELSFAAVHQLLVPFLDSVRGLPGPQREALSSAFGLAAGPPPDQLLAGIGVMATMASVAEKQPVLCLIDDAQWLDRASADVLGFVARRLSADAIAILFAVRDHENDGVEALTGLPELRLAGLPDDAAHQLLMSVAGQPLDYSVGRQVVAGTAGNPLALTEVGHHLSAAERSGALPLPEPLHLGARLEALLYERVRSLPASARMLLLLAAAEPAAEPGLLWKSAELLGVSQEEGDIPGVTAVIRFDPDVCFLPPMMRSAVYHSAAAGERRRAHQALAAASEALLDPDRRAWHLAAAATGADERAARELASCAERARRRGNWARCAAFLDRAARLTPGPARRAERTLATAEARLNADDPGGAAALAEQAEAQLADPGARARARRLQGTARQVLGQPAEATAMLLEAALALQPLDPWLARDSLLHAFEAALTAGQLASGAGPAEVLQAARVVPGPCGAQPTAADLAFDGFAALEGRGQEAGVARLRQATALAVRQSYHGEQPGFGFLAWSAARELLDDAALHAICTRGLARARARGPAAQMAFMLGLVGHSEVLAGRFTAAEAAVREAREVAAVTGAAAQHQARASELWVLAWRGHAAAARPLADASLRDFNDGGLGSMVDATRGALTVLELGLGNYQAALRQALSASADPLARAELVPELIEAAVRGGAAGTAASALPALAVRARGTGTDWAVGLMLRSRALLAADADAEELYRAAIEHLARTRIVPQLGRSHLLYGEWLRRRRRRREARSALRSAYEILEGVGAEAFAERARTELLATGEHVRRQNAVTRRELTPQELQIAGLAGRDSQAAVHQREHRRISPEEGVPQARGDQPDRAGPLLAKPLLSQPTARPWGRGQDR
jgi:hypothetical protein